MERSSNPDVYWRTALAERSRKPDVYWSTARKWIAGFVGLMAVASTAVYSVFWSQLVNPSVSSAEMGDCTSSGAAPATFTWPLVWGGHGSASARALTPLLVGCNIALIMMGVMLGVWYKLRKHIESGPQRQWDRTKGVVESVKGRSVFKARHAFNFLFLAFITLGVYLSGFVLAVTGAPPARSVFTVLGCTDLPPISGIWGGLVWPPTIYLAVATIVGHAMIPETPVGTTPISWNGEGGGEKIALTTRTINKPVLGLTIAMTLATMALAGVAIGTYHDNLSLTADGGGHMCDCSTPMPAAQQVVCIDARSALWYGIVGSGGGLWTTVGLVAIILGVTLVIAGSNMGTGGTRTWINKPALRYIIITAMAVALIVLGYATGALWGAPNSELAELCCPSGTCPAVSGYTSGILMCLASITWCLSVLTGHYIAKEPTYEELVEFYKKKGVESADRQIAMSGREQIFDVGVVGGMRKRDASSFD